MRAGVLAGLAVAAGSGLCLGQAATFTLIGTGAGSAGPVSHDGSTVVGSDLTFPFSAFRWTASGGRQLLPAPEGDLWCFGTAVSQDGSTVIGLASDFSGAVGIGVWRTGVTGGQRLFNGGIYESISGMGLSGDGGVAVGQFVYTPNQYGFRWTAELGLMPLYSSSGNSDHDSRAAAVSLDGAVSVGFGETDAHPAGEAMIWTLGVAGPVALPLGALPHTAPTRSDATDISADGSVVVGFTESLSDGTAPPSFAQAFRWTAGTGLVPLGALPHVEGRVISRAQAVSADGSVIVGSCDTSSTPRVMEAFVWDATNGMRRLHDVLTAGGATVPAGFQIQEALGISGDGRVIAGYGKTASRTQMAWVATIPVVTPPSCAADFDDSGSVAVADIFAFLSAWFSNAPAADFNGSEAVEVADIFAFLSAWFAGCD